MLNVWRVWDIHYGFDYVGCFKELNGLLDVWEGIGNVHAVKGLIKDNGIELAWWESKKCIASTMEYVDNFGQ